MDGAVVEIFDPLAPKADRLATYAGLSLSPLADGRIVVGALYRAKGQQSPAINLALMGARGPIDRRLGSLSVGGGTIERYCLSGYGDSTLQVSAIVSETASSSRLFTRPFVLPSRSSEPALVDTGVTFGPEGAAAEVACVRAWGDPDGRQQVAVYTTGRNGRPDTVMARRFVWQFDPTSMSYRYVRSGAALVVHRQLSGPSGRSGPVVAEPVALPVSGGTYAIAWVQTPLETTTVRSEIGAALVDFSAAPVILYKKTFRADNPTAVANDAPSLAGQTRTQFALAWQTRGPDGRIGAEVRTLDAVGRETAVAIPRTPKTTLVGPRVFAVPGYGAAFAALVEAEVDPVDVAPTHRVATLTTANFWFESRVTRGSATTVVDIGGDPSEPDRRFLFATFADGRHHALGWTASSGRSVRAAIVASRAEIYGGDDDDYIVGGDNEVVVHARGGNDKVIGSIADDRLDGGPGADLISGSLGLDIASYADATAGVTVDLANASRGTGDARRDRFDSIEGLAGSAFADRLYGDDRPNVISGGSGADHLSGRDGDDILEPGVGAADVIDGGRGRDRVSYRETYYPLTADLGDPLQNQGAAKGDLWTDVEGIEGSEADDDLSGSDAGDLLLGGGGSDRLRGGRGADVLDGGAGSNDVTGGPGRDDFRLAVGAGRYDRIHDFAPTDGDGIVLLASAFRDGDGDPAFTTADFPADAFVSGRKPRPTSARPVVLYDRGTGVLSFDADGRGPLPATGFATLDGIPDLQAKDITVY